MATPWALRSVLLLLVPLRPALAAPEGESQKTCREGCVCGVEAPELDPKPPFPVMDCEVRLQGLLVKMLVPQRTWHESGTWSEVIDTLVAGHNTMNIFGAGLGENKYPPASLLDLGPGKLVLDVGANGGVWALLVTLFHPEVRIIAVEPSPSMSGLARANLRRNGVSEERAMVLNAGLTSDGRNLTISEHPKSSDYSSALYEWNGTSSIVPGVTFEQLLAYKKPSEELVYAKVDCEGCEYEVLDEMRALSVPVLLECHMSEWFGLEAAFNNAEFERCRALAESASALHFQRRVKRQDPVSLTMVGMQHMGVNQSLAAELFQLANQRWAANMESMPTSVSSQLAVMQYTMLMDIYRRISSFFLASYLEWGEGLPMDLSGAAALFEGIASAGPLKLTKETEWLGRPIASIVEAMTTASMFRLGELLAQQRHWPQRMAEESAGQPSEGSDGALEEARGWWLEAARRGHALARVRMEPEPAQYLAGTNGLFPGNDRRHLGAMVQMQGIGLDPAQQMLLLGTTTATGFDECMREDQLSQLPRWQDVFRQQGLGEYSEGAEAYRFRSWFHSAMNCWFPIKL